MGICDQHLVLHSKALLLVAASIEMVRGSAEFPSILCESELSGA